MTSAKYSYPDNRRITLWDCPGIGTETFPDLERYCKKVDIEKYDAFVIMSATRFTAHAGNLARKVKSINKPFFFVRTKIDQDYQNERRTKRSEFNEVAMLDEIKADCSKNLKLKEATIDDNDIFLMSNIYRYQWDFSRLTTAINKGLPIRKRECFLFSMLILSEDILEKKVEALKGRVFLVAFFQSIIWKVFSNKMSSGKDDFELIIKKVEFYRSQLGFPKEDSKEFEEMPAQRQEAVRRFYLKPTTKDVESWLEEFDTERGDANTESGENKAEFPSWLDIDKAIEAPCKFVYRSLHHVLDEMKDIALEIVKDAAARSEPDMNID